MNFFLSFLFINQILYSALLLNEEYIYLVSHNNFIWANIDLIWEIINHPIQMLQLYEFALHVSIEY